MSQEHASEDFNSSYLPLIKGANRVLDALSFVWRSCVTVLIISLSVIGALSIGLSFVASRQVLFAEGIIFLAISAWIFFRNVTGTCNRCCTDDIPRWKRTLLSFVGSNDSVNVQRDGQSVMENLMLVIDASDEWISLIRRDVFSMLFWPIVGAVAFFLSIYSVGILILQVSAVLLVAYVFVLTVVVYYSVSLKFRGWKQRVVKFRAYAAMALENL